MKPTETWINFLKDIPIAIVYILSSPLFILVLPLSILGLTEWLITLGNSTSIWHFLTWVAGEWILKPFHNWE
jgi:uncharacterized membrane protein YvlD (DUF360 family)